MNENIYIRARLLIAIRTEITDNVEIINDKNGRFIILVLLLYKIFVR